MSGNDVLGIKIGFFVIPTFWRILDEHNWIRCRLLPSWLPYWPCRWWNSAFIGFIQIQCKRGRIHRCRCNNRDGDGGRRTRNRTRDRHAQSVDHGLSLLFALFPGRNTGSVTGLPLFCGRGGGIVTRWLCSSGSARTIHFEERDDRSDMKCRRCGSSVQPEIIETYFQLGEGDICTLGLKITYYHAQTKKTRSKKSPPNFKSAIIRTSKKSFESTVGFT